MNSENTFLNYDKPVENLKVILPSPSEPTSTRLIGFIALIDEMMDDRGKLWFRFFVTLAS